MCDPDFVLAVVLTEMFRVCDPDCAGCCFD